MNAPDAFPFFFRQRERRQGCSITIPVSEITGIQIDTVRKYSKKACPFLYLQLGIREFVVEGFAPFHVEFNLRFFRYLNAGTASKHFKITDELGNCHLPIQGNLFSILCCSQNPNTGGNSDCQNRGNDGENDDSDNEFNHGEPGWRAEKAERLHCALYLEEIKEER